MMARRCGRRARSTLRSQGPVHFAVARLNREIFDLRLVAVTQIWLRARVRPLLVTLPDQTVLTVADALVRIEHLGDRLAVFNSGPGVVSYQGVVGKGKLIAARYVHLWPEQSAKDPLGAGLELMGDVATVEDGNHLRVTGGNKGSVTFSGARFRVERDQSLVITPLAGDRFPQKGVGLEPSRSEQDKPDGKAK